MKPKFKIIIAFIGLTWLINACKPDYTTEVSDSTLARLKPVLVENLEVQNAPIPVQASGVLSSKAETRLSFKTGGIIRTIHTEEGQKVKQGQLLASLDMVEINAQVLMAQNAVDKAQRDLRRIKNLYQDEVATLEQLQDLTTIYEVATAELNIAKFNQQYSRIVASADGKILRRYSEKGELVVSGAPIFLFAPQGRQSFIMRIGLADRDIVLLSPGDSAQIAFDAYSNQVFKARVTEIAEAADPMTGAFEIELTLEPSRLNLKNGFVGKVSVFPSQQPPYFKVSIDALVEAEKDEAKIFIYDSSTKTAQKIKLVPDHIGRDYFTVLAQPGVESVAVITKGGAYLKDGEKVKPTTLNL